MDWTLMVGNHDRREALLEVFPDLPRSPGGFLQRALSFPGWDLLTLDTLDGPPYPAGHHAGRLCDARLAWLDARLAEAANRQVLVMSHHHAVPSGLPGMDRIALQEPEVLLDRLRRHGRALLVSGHIHKTISGVHRGLPWAVLKSTCHQAPLDLADTDSSSSIDEGAGYGVILLGNDGATVHCEEVPGGRDGRASASGSA